MSKKSGGLLFIFFFISRLIFINTQDVFFDSGEYISLFSSPNYFQAIISGHAPPHEGYIILFWPVFHLAQFLHFDPVLAIILGQILLACLTIFCFYRFVSFIADKRVALIASIIASLTPLFWITNVTIMMEIAYISFFFLSLFILVKYLKTNTNVYLHLSAFLFTLAFLTHMLTLLWLPLLLYMSFLRTQESGSAKRKNANLVKRWIPGLRPGMTILITFSIYLATFSILNILFISGVSKTNIPEVIHHLYLTKGGELAYLPLNLKGFLVSMRNFLIPLLRNNTSLIVILGFISLIVYLRKNKKFFVFGFLFIVPALYANQWWDSLLNGRHAVLSSFGFAFLVAYLVRKKPLLTILLLTFTILTALPTLSLLKKDVPYIIEANFAKSLPKDSMLIESHFARPQVEKAYRGQLFSVNEPGSDKENLKREINKYLANKKPVFISSAALSEPYGLYSGPYLHNITLSYAKPFEMEGVIKNYTLVPHKTLSAEDNLLIYKIISTKPSAYPQIKNMKNSYRRIDYHDPIWKVTLSWQTPGVF